MAGTKAVVEKVKKLVAKIDKSSAGDAPDWIKYVDMLTGVLAAVAGFLAVRSTSLTNDAIYESDQAILAQTEASDAWSEYQANSIKARIVETQLVASSPPDEADRAALTKNDDEFRSRQPSLQKTATDKIKERDGHMSKGLQHLEEKDLLGYGSLAIQLGIALASVAAMTRLRTAFAAGVLAGVAGLAVTAYAFLGHIAIP